MLADGGLLPWPPEDLMVEGLLANHFGYSLLDLDRADPFPVASRRAP